MQDLDSYFRTILDMETVSGIDPSLNGLQVGDTGKVIKRAAFAVDACMETFKRAYDWGADLLFVHHGLFWGHQLAVTGNHFERLSYLIRNNLSLYAAHLPLDMNPDFGNNYGIAKQLGLENLEPFGNYKGKNLGVTGKFREEKTIEQVLTLLDTDRKEILNILPFGKPANSTVAIVSGGATGEVSQALEKNIDLYITGDQSHSVYHTCLEGRVNMISGGHYFTETFGPKLLSEKLNRDKDLKTVFIDIPTGL